MHSLTCNLSKSGLGGSSAAANREYGVVDADPTDVGEVKTIFQADWDRTSPALGDANLLVSPVNARVKLTDLLGAARHTLLVEDEEMLDAPSEDALIAAARRGVSVEVVLPMPTSGAADSGADVARLVHGGVRVRYLVAPYMHAKLIVTDGTRAFVGSENFSGTSLDQNRELGVLIAESDVLATLARVFALDWAAGYDA